MFLAEWPGDLDAWKTAGLYVGAIVVLYLAAIWLTLIFWTYRDIRQRSRDPIVQLMATLLVLVFSFPGHWIYLIVRPRHTLTDLYERSLEEEALLQELEDQKGCPTCKRRVLDEFLLCPSCRTQLKEPCRSCNRPLSYAWIACPFCGVEKAPREAFPRPQPGAPRVGPQPAPQQRVAAQAQAPARVPNGNRPPVQSRAASSPVPIQQPRDPFASRPPAPRGSDDAPVIDATAD